MLARINLAPVRFRRACAPEGPIAKVAWTTVSLYGSTVIQANAWLREGLRPTREPGIYSNADGTGSDATAAVARHKAISEALERWAYDTTYRGAARARYGFDADPTSAGMAAFPGLVSTPARRAAFDEAVERASLLAWSHRLLASKLRATRWPDINAVELEPVAGRTCAILFRRNEAGFYAYGHAAGASFEQAGARALVELGRNELVLGRSLRAAAAEGGQPANLFERRCIYFSTTAGHESFLSRINACAAGRFRQPELLVDTEIEGPWSAYATVWRVLFRPSVEGYLRELDVFIC
jgi:hypothetical protein